MDDREYRVHSAERDVNPAFTLNQIGKFAFKQATLTERYPTMNLTAAQLMCALTMEAVLNRVGYKIFVEDASEPALWTAVERLAPREKLDAILERLNLRVEFGAAPFQDFGPMFRFRNDVVHAKSMTLRTGDIPPDAIDEEHRVDCDAVPHLLAGWERAVSAENAKRWRDAVYGMSAALSEAADCVDPVMVTGSTWAGSWQSADGG